MEITVNGEPTQVPNGINATALLERLGLTGKRVAVEVNREIVPRSTFDSHELKPGDRVEVVGAIGGG